MALFNWSIACFLAIFVCFVQSQGAEEWGQEWNDLRTTFIPGLDASVGGDLGGLRLPMVLSEVPPPKDCMFVLGDSLYYGHRVAHPFGNDTYNSVATLHDVNGNIAGIQAMFPLEETLLENNTFNYEKVPMFRRATIGGMDFFVLTAYFVDPEIICSSGREMTHGVLETGDRLVFQNGISPSILLLAPKNRTEAIEAGYGPNKCLPGMGNHTFYGMFPTTNCDEIVPVFLLQNLAGYLTGFGFNLVGRGTSGRFEHPPGYILDIIIGPSQPDCLLQVVESIGVTTMHFYFTNTNPACAA